jgi:fatty acid desaturase
LLAAQIFAGRIISNMQRTNRRFDEAEAISDPLGQHEDTFQPPGYTMKEIYDAIPPHCFHSSTLRSLSYVLRDFAISITLVYFAAKYIPLIQNIYLRVPAWTAYTVCQGLVFTGLWELAHECGHGALSKHKWANDAMGMVIHSFLLVPYHSWRFTHSQHHKATNNLDRDIAFVPVLKGDYIAARSTSKNRLKAWELMEDTPMVALVTLFFHQLVAFPIYLTINNFAIPRMRAAPWHKRSHFYFGGDGPNFKPANRQDIIISDLGIGVALTVLWASVNHFGRWNVALFYIFPYLWTNHWIRKFDFMSPRGGSSQNTPVLTTCSYNNVPPTYRCIITLLPF